MAFTSAKFSESPLKTSLPLFSRSSTLNLVFSCSNCNLSFRILRPFSSLRSTENSSNSYSYPWDDEQHPKPSPKSNTSFAPWLNKSPSTKSSTQSRDLEDNKTVTELNAIQSIVLRLRNLGLGTDDEAEEENRSEVEARDVLPLSGEERLGDLLKREWVLPDSTLFEDAGDDMVLLPWEKDEEKDEVEEGERGLKSKKRMKAPTMAELTLEEEELRRLRRVGMTVREKISVPKAGITQALLEKIHDKWRKEEVVRLKFHEVLARNMKMAHEIVEHRTGGLVIWRSGSLMMVYRGRNYKGLKYSCEPNERQPERLFVPEAGNLLKTKDSNVISSLEKSEPVVRNQVQSGTMTMEEAEYNSLIDGLGPRFVGWWGTGVLPVDADLLPPTIPGYKTPFRRLPTGMRSSLTNSEITNLRKLAKALPCHFALGRNRNHQGLASAIIKVWEKSLVVKIAVKRGIQNTNNKLMADELKNLTGGSLLIRNKYYIVIYRGKDFVPTNVAEVLAERQELVNQVQEVEENLRCGSVDAIPSEEDKATAQAGSLAEFYEAQARWGRDISAEEREKMMEEAAEAKSIKLIKKVEHKLAVAQAKKLRAERLLAKIEASMVPAGPDCDQETITDEERVVFRRIGLRMKPYLLLGIRGVFDGVIENMHLHWKHRELVKLITKQKTLAFVEDTARLLEYESGGILVAIERVPKGFSLIYYRGKNYRRPITIRPRNLLTKAKALKRSVAMQRHEALSQHISELEKTIEQIAKEIGMSQDLKFEDSRSIGNHNHMDQISESTLSEDEDSDVYDNDGDFHDEEDTSWEDEDSEFSSSKNNGLPMKTV